MSDPQKPSSIEEQLALYRTRKKREIEKEDRKKRIVDYLFWIMSFGSSRSGSETSVSESGLNASVSAENDSEDSGDKRIQESNLANEKVLRKRPGLSRNSSSSFSDVQEFQQPSVFERYTTVDWVILCLKFAMWMLLWKIFILLEFGAVFFIFSAFIFIWYNMRNEPKKEGEISAYSVFNPNCETIDGTFTAEQFERELLHKMY